jgi:Flp pilus assembly protein TadD
MSWSRAAWAVLAAVAAGCGQGDGVALLRDDREYQATLDRVHRLTSGPFQSVREGKPLNDGEKQRVVEAQRAIESLVGFAPTKYSLYVLRGLAHAALEEKGEAARSFRQALELVPPEPSEADLFVVGQVHTQLSRLHFDSGDFEAAAREAALAVEASPNDIEGYVALASAQIQRRQIDAAKETLEAAQRLDPYFPRVRQLKKLIDGG